MALVYSELPDGSLTAIEDEVLVVVRFLSEIDYVCEVWLGDEVPAYSSTAQTIDVLKMRVQRWLAEALS